MGQVQIKKANAVTAIFEFSTALSKLVCEDQDHLDLSNRLRVAIKTMLDGELFVLTKQTFTLLHSFKGMTNSWLLEYAMHLKQALQNVDGLSIHSTDFIAVKAVLERKKQLTYLSQDSQSTCKSRRWCNPAERKLWKHTC